MTELTQNSNVWILEGVNPIYFLVYHCDRLYGEESFWYPCSQCQRQILGAHDDEFYARGDYHYFYKDDRCFAGWDNVICRDCLVFHPDCYKKLLSG